MTSSLNEKIEIQKQLIRITEESLILQKRNMIRIRNEFSKAVLLHREIKEEISKFNLCIDISSFDKRIANIKNQLKTAADNERSFEEILIKQKKFLDQLCECEQNDLLNSAIKK